MRIDFRCFGPVLTSNKRSGCLTGLFTESIKRFFTKCAHFESILWAYKLRIMIGYFYLYLNHCFITKDVVTDSNGITERKMELIKILVVDDESRMRKLVKDFLVKKNYEVLEASDGSEALDIFFDKPDISLIILDVMMPKVDGWQVCREIRQYSKVPIIMLTARSDERDELLGFELGVDEYISKPFSPKILTARVEAILRRTTSVSQDAILEYGGVMINKSAHTVRIDKEEIELSYKEFELLAYFMENKGIALSREKILNSVWNYDYFGDARTIDTHVKKLRSKMGAKGELIKTIWGMGYKFETD